jgi:hypothetical protein
MSIVWTNVLIGIIPLGELGNMFDRAIRNTKNSFLPTALDLKNEWQKYEAELAEGARKKPKPKEPPIR